MNKKYNTIKDNCREGLIDFLLKAIEAIPVIKKAKILDVGCGTGVPALTLANKFTESMIIAVDEDSETIAYLTYKVNKLNLSERFTLLCNSVFNVELKEKHFDIILAEGFLNVVGFKKGFDKINKLLKTNGFIIIHDDTSNKEWKIEFIKKNNYEIIDSFSLNEQVWWDCYYKGFENEISLCQDDDCLELLQSVKKEIELYKKDSSAFNSIYYIIKKK